MSLPTKDMLLALRCSDDIVFFRFSAMPPFQAAFMLSVLFTSPLLVISLNIVTDNADVTDSEIQFSTYTTCECCTSDVIGPCCIKCMRQATVMNKFSHSFPRSTSKVLHNYLRHVSRVSQFGPLLQEEDLSEVKGTGAPQPSYQGIRVCYCCLQERFEPQTSHYSNTQFVCCLVCERELTQIFNSVGQPSGTGSLPFSQPGYSFTDEVVVRSSGVASDEHDKEVMSRATDRIEKRMSMECMCCSNSGIIDCCAKCRIRF